jgi:hypothetical protein
MVDYNLSIRFVYSNGVPVGRATAAVFDSDTVIHRNNIWNPFDDTSEEVRSAIAQFSVNENGWISGTVTLAADDAPKFSVEVTKDGVTAGPFPVVAPPPSARALDITINTGWTNGPNRCLRHEDPNLLARNFRRGVRQTMFQIQRMPSLPGSSIVFPQPITIMRPLAMAPDPLDTFMVLPAVPPPHYIQARRSAAQMFTDAESATMGAPPPEYTSVSQYNTVTYSGLPGSMPKPRSVDRQGDAVISDELFAFQRIGGSNPLTIARVGSLDAPVIPPGFELSEAFVRARTGLRLDQLQSARRLYVCDYLRLAPLLAPFRQPNRQAQTAVALFYYGRPPKPPPANLAVGAGLHGTAASNRVVSGVTPSGSSAAPAPVEGPSPGMVLRPLAIMVVNADGTRETVTPDQGPKWDKAKMVVQVADTTTHELEMHLWGCHFAMEPVVLSMIRHLDEKHPLRELLVRHSYGLLWINNHGIVTLIHPTLGEAHRLLMLDFNGMASVMAIAQGRWTWRSTQIRRDLTRRGMNQADSILSYPYRDDGLRVLDIIRQFTGEYVDIYYDNDAEVGRDSELASWFSEMVSLGVTLLPILTTKSALADFLADYIFQMTALHAAINAPQWDYHANSLNMPGYLRTPEPPGGSPAMLAPVKRDAVAMMSLMGRLATFHWEQGLGSYRDWSPLAAVSTLKPFPDASAEAAAARFRTAAEALHNQMAAEPNRADYTHLMPKSLDNSTHT